MCIRDRGTHFARTAADHVVPMSDLDASLTEGLADHASRRAGWTPVVRSDIEPSAQLFRVLESSTRKAHRQVNLIVRSRNNFPSHSSRKRFAGGLTEARKIATLAEMRGMQIAPHFFSYGPLTWVAMANLCMATPNVLILEANALRENPSGPKGLNKNQFFKEPIKTVGYYFTPSGKPDWVTNTMGNSS